MKKFLKKLKEKILDLIIEVGVPELLLIIFYIIGMIISYFTKDYAVFGLLAGFGLILIIIGIAVAIQDHLEFIQELKKRKKFEEVNSSKWE